MSRTKEFQEWIANPKREGRESDFRRNRPMTEAEVKIAERASEDWARMNWSEGR